MLTFVYWQKSRRERFERGIYDNNYVWILGRIDFSFVVKSLCFESFDGFWEWRKHADVTGRDLMRK
jgi:hypothetical protein